MASTSLRLPVSTGLSPLGVISKTTAKSMALFAANEIFDCKATTGSPAVISVFFSTPVSIPTGLASDRHLPIKVSRLLSKPEIGRLCEK